METKRKAFYQSPSIEITEIESESLLDISTTEGEEGGNTGGDDDGSGEILSKGRDSFYEW